MNRGIRGGGVAQIPFCPWRHAEPIRCSSPMNRGVRESCLRRANPFLSLATLRAQAVQFPDESRRLRGCFLRYGVTVMVSGPVPL